MADIYIEFRDGRNRQVFDVEKYEFNKEFGVFIIEKNGFRSFFPSDDISIFGERNTILGGRYR